MTRQERQYKLEQRIREAVAQRMGGKFPEYMTLQAEATAKVTMIVDKAYEALTNTRASIARYDIKRQEATMAPLMKDYKSLIELQHRLYASLGLNNTINAFQV